MTEWQFQNGMVSGKGKTSEIQGKNGNATGIKKM